MLEDLFLSPVEWLLDFDRAFFFSSVSPITFRELVARVYFPTPFPIFRTVLFPFPKRGGRQFGPLHYPSYTSALGILFKIFFHGAQTTGIWKFAEREVA